MSEITHYSPCEGIDVYDNVFDLSKRFDIQESVRKSVFQIGWPDNNYTSNESYMYSRWTPEKLNAINFFSDFTENHPLHEKVNPDKFIRCIINSDVTSNVHWTHTHINENVFLYYVNMEWQDQWGGETLFFNKKKNTDIIFGSRYTPGRVIWFDGEYPHTIKSQSRNAPQYRFSVSLFFEK